jgi:hypothetical protein
VAAGEWPYADFGWGYGPGQALIVALPFELFDPSVVWWRIVRVAADATAALLVWRLAGRVAPPSWALLAWAAAALTAAQPTSANPAAVALALALGSLVVASRGSDPVEGWTSTSRGSDPVEGWTSRGSDPVEGWTSRGSDPVEGSVEGLTPLAAGVLAGLAGFWRPDFGLVALAAVAVALLVRRAPRAALVAAGAALGTAVVLYLPFAIAAGPGELWDTFVAGPVRDGGSWGLDFPLVYDGPLRGWPPRALATDLKDLLGYELPLTGVVLLPAAALTARRATPVLAGLLVLAAGLLVYLFSRPDEQHAQPLLIVACALVPAALATRPRRPIAAVLMAGAALILAGGAANRLSALLLPPELEPVHLAGVPGIRVPPEEARALPPMVDEVQRLVPAGEPIYVAPRRSDLVTLSAPIVHFLTRRPNVLRDDVLLQARPAEQERIVAALRRARPKAIVRWTDPISSRPEPNERGRPSGSRALDEYLGEAYRLQERFGAYDVLVPR